MKFFFGLLLGLILAIAIAGAAVKMAWGGITDIDFDDDDSAKLSQSYDLTDFDRIEIAGVFDLDVEVGGDYSVEVRGSQKSLDRAEISVENGELRLDLADNDGDGQRRIIRGGGLAARVTMPMLVAVEAMGVVDGDISGVEAEDFSVDLSGVGEMTVSGSCTRLSANMSGLGELDAGDLRCESVEVDMSGVGEAEVYASQAVDASISGIGKIEILGSPEDVSKDSSSPFARISVN